MLLICRKEDSNLHPKLLRLGPEPSASASSAISATDVILTVSPFFARGHTFGEMTDYGYLLTQRKKFA